MKYLGENEVSDSIIVELSKPEYSQLCALQSELGRSNRDNATMPYMRLLDSDITPLVAAIRGFMANVVRLRRVRGYIDDVIDAMGVDQGALGN